MIFPFPKTRNPLEVYDNIIALRSAIYRTGDIDEVFESNDYIGHLEDGSVKWSALGWIFNNIFSVAFVDMIDESYDEDGLSALDRAFETLQFAGIRPGAFCEMQKGTPKAELIENMTLFWKSYCDEDILALKE